MNMCTGTCITLSVIHVYKHKELHLKLGHSEFVGKTSVVVIENLLNLQLSSHLI